MKAGNAHLVFLTKGLKVFGYGDNSKYQLVPQGECYYNYPVQLLIYDKINVDPCDKCNLENYVAQGSLMIPTSPVVPPVCSQSSNQFNCSFGGLVSGTMTISVAGTYDDTASHTVTSQNVTLNVTVPVFGSGSNCGGSFTGTILFAGPASVTLATVPTVLNYYSGSTLEGTFSVVAVDPSILSSSIASSVVGSSITVSTGGNSCNISVPVCVPVTLATAGSISPPGLQLFQLAPSEGSSRFFLLSPIDVTSTLCTNINVTCPLTQCTSEDVLPIRQPCWINIYAGWNNTVLVDNTGRLYVLGDLSTVRDNEELLEKSCLEKLLNETAATIKFPACELNCTTQPVNKSCACQSPCGHPPKTKTDLSKFEVELALVPDVIKKYIPASCGEPCSDVFSVSNKTNVCDFLKKLKACNDAPQCDNTCVSCDNNIYIKYGKHCIEGDVVQHISQYPLVVLNHKSVSNTLAYLNNPAITSSNVDDLFKLLQGGTQVPFVTEVFNFDYTSSRIEFTNTTYNIDGQSEAIDQILLLNPGSSSLITGNTKPLGYFPLYLDIENDQRGIQMRTDDCTDRKYNINFIVQPYGSSYVSGSYYPYANFVLNYGDVLGSVELNNLRAALGNFSYQNSPQYKNPITNKVYLTYVQGADNIVLDRCTANPPKHMITHDVPTVFNLNRKVLDVAVSDKSLVVLTGSVRCPNEVFVWGENCHGELGLGTYRNTLCFKKVNRCLMDCQVVKLAAGRYITVFLTASGAAYASGQLWSIFSSNTPKPFNCVNPCWKVRRVSISRNHVVLLTSENQVYTFGRNQYGQLGTGNFETYCEPRLVSKFCGLSKCDGRYVNKLLNHPAIAYYDGDDAYGSDDDFKVCEKFIHKPKDGCERYRCKSKCEPKCEQKFKCKEQKERDYKCCEGKEKKCGPCRRECEDKRRACHKLLPKRKKMWTMS